MSEQRTTILFEDEGIQNLEECLGLSIDTALAESAALIVFTSQGLGVRKAFERVFSDQTPLRIVGVTCSPFYKVPSSDPTKDPHRPGTSDWSGLEGLPNVDIVKARLPFSSIRTRIGADTLSEYPREVLSIFGGGLALCVQAVAMACDAGTVRPEERVVAMAADTAIIALAATTDDMFDPRYGLVVEQILCKPRRYTALRPLQFSSQVVDTEGVEVLPPSGDVPLLEKAPTIDDEGESNDTEE